MRHELHHFPYPHFSSAFPSCQIQFSGFPGRTRHRVQPNRQALGAGRAWQSLRHGDPVGGLPRAGVLRPWTGENLSHAECGDARGFLFFVFFFIYFSVWWAVWAAFGLAKKGLLWQGRDREGIGPEKLNHHLVTRRLRSLPLRHERLHLGAQAPAHRGSAMTRSCDWNRTFKAVQM